MSNCHENAQAFSWLLGEALCIMLNCYSNTDLTKTIIIMLRGGFKMSTTETNQQTVLEWGSRSARLRMDR